MCSAQPTPPAKPGRFRKMQASSTRRVIVVGSPVGVGLAGTHETAPHGLGMELHLLGLDPHERPHDDLHVVVVDEVGAVAAAPLLELLGRPVEHALAALAVDALVVRPEERRVELPGSLLVGILERDELVDVLVAVDGLAGDGLTHRAAGYSPR